jgi:alpha-1,3-fucosyltransferase
MVSNCRTSSHREDLVNELQNFVGVDVFGNCGKLTCAKSNDYDPGT